MLKKIEMIMGTLWHWKTPQLNALLVAIKARKVNEKKNEKWRRQSRPKIRTTNNVEWPFPLSKNQNKLFVEWEIGPSASWIHKKTSVTGTAAYIEKRWTFTPDMEDQQQQDGKLLNVAEAARPGDCSHKKWNCSHISQTVDRTQINEQKH